jgi:hypothetical protein
LTKKQEARAEWQVSAGPILASAKGKRKANSMLRADSAERQASRFQWRVRRTQALKLLYAAHAIEGLGPHDAFIFLALGGGYDISVGPEERQLFREARRWVKRHNGFRREDAVLLAQTVERLICSRECCPAPKNTEGSSKGEAS